MKNQEQKSNSTTRNGTKLISQYYNTSNNFYNDRYDKGGKSKPTAEGLDQGRKGAADVVAGINKVKIQHHDPKAIQPTNKKKLRRFEGKYGTKYNVE